MPFLYGNSLTAICVIWVLKVLKLHFLLLNAFLYYNLQSLSSMYFFTHTPFTLQKRIQNCMTGFRIHLLPCFKKISCNQHTYRYTFWTLTFWRVPGKQWMKINRNSTAECLKNEVQCILTWMWAFRLRHSSGLQW